MDYLEIEERPPEVKKLIYGTLPFKFINKMIDASVISDKLNREVGFSICYSKDKGFYVNDLTIGEADEVFIRRCEDNTIGTFHTHPTSTNFSIEDVYYAIFYRDRLMCVGSVEKGETGVYVEKERKAYDIDFPIVNIRCATVDTDPILLDKYKSLLGRVIHKIDDFARKMSKAKTEQEFKKYEDEYKKARREGREIVDDIESKRIIEYGSSGIRTSEAGDEVSIALIVDRATIRQRVVE